MGFILDIEKGRFGTYLTFFVTSFALFLGLSLSALGQESGAPSDAAGVHTEWIESYASRMATEQRKRFRFHLDYPNGYYCITLGDDVAGEKHKSADFRPSCHLWVELEENRLKILENGTPRELSSLIQSDDSDEFSRPLLFGGGRYGLSGFVLHDGSFNVFFVHDFEFGAEKATRFFPFDPSYEVTASLSFLLSSSPEEPAVKLTFSLLGQTHELKLSRNQLDRDYVLVHFSDLTTGVTTYGGGRHLWIQPPKYMGQMESGDSVELDFNYAKFPPCYYSPAYTCPLPTHHLDIQVRAGEQL